LTSPAFSSVESESVLTGMPRISLALRQRQRQREQESKSPFVFVSERGTPFSTRGFQAVVERAAVKSNAARRRKRKAQA
jgi:hypothetical protein